MEPWYGAVLFGLGIIAGFINVMAGGGSLLTLPVMVFMGMPGPVANGTNRIAVLAQNITAAIAFFKRGVSDLRLGITLSLVTLPGAVAGAMMGTRLEGIWFNRILAIIMIGVMVSMVFQKKTKHQIQTTRPPRKSLIAGHLGMVLVGFYGGFIQVGVGFVLIPVLHRLMGFDLVRVNMYKAFIIASYSVPALIIFAARVDILWLLGICLAAGNSIGGWLGAHISVSRGEGPIRLILNSILVLFIIKLLLFP